MLNLSSSVMKLRHYQRKTKQNRKTNNHLLVYGHLLFIVLFVCFCLFIAISGQHTLLFSHKMQNRVRQKEFYYI